jgi:hypothetical protein
MRARLTTLALIGLALAAPPALSAQDICAGLLTGVESGKKGFTDGGAVAMPPLTDCRIRENSDRPRQRQMVCSVAYEKRSCSTTVQTLYQQLLRDVRNCAATNWPQSRVDSNGYTESLGGDGAFTTFRNVAASTEGYHLDVVVGWSTERYRSGRSDCLVDVSIRMR